MDVERSCGVLVVRGQPVRDVLLMVHPTRLDIPKGHVDPGETDLQCALRELHEETGIGADDVAIDPEFRFELCYPVLSKRLGAWCDKTLVVFLGRLLRDVPIVVTEHTGHRWLPWNPPHQIQPQTIDPLLAHLAAHLGGAG
ncbi:MAG: NUDIX domain-containing protein [Planctomycetales bacterium]|nr:NUDIX domain-containing protein [Planctomycetales bacterium]